MNDLQVAYVIVGYYEIYLSEYSESHSSLMLKFIFLLTQVFLNMLQKCINLELPLWHRIMVLEVLRVCIGYIFNNLIYGSEMKNNIFFTRQWFNFIYASGMKYLSFSIDNENQVIIAGVLCWSQDIAFIVPNIWYVRSWPRNCL